MKKMFFLVTAMAFLASGTLAMARDVTWDSLRQQWNQQQGEQKKQNAKFKAEGSQTKPPADEATAPPSPKKDK